MPTDTAAPCFKDIASITVIYDGSGDSGGIEEIDATSIADAPVELTHDQKEYVEERCYDFMPSGFENNEGGHGTITIDVINNEMSMSHSDRTSESFRDDHVIPPAVARLLRIALGSERIAAWRTLGVCELRVELTSYDGRQHRLLDEDRRLVADNTSSDDDGLDKLDREIEHHFPAPHDADPGTEDWSLCLPLIAVAPTRTRNGRRKLTPRRGSITIGWCEESTEESCDSATFVVSKDADQ